MESLDYWRLHDELSIIEAALLFAEVDPSSGEGVNVESNHVLNRPKGYEAIKGAIAKALQGGAIQGQVKPEHEYDGFGNRACEIEGSIDPAESYVDVESLRQWLSKRGIRTGFFFPEETPKETDMPGYLDRDHPRYAPKLAAAVRAWEAMEDESNLIKKTPRQALEAWLRSHTEQYELTKDDGSENEKGIEECANVANWKGGGPPKTPGSKKK